MRKIPETAPFMRRFKKGQPVGIFPRITLPVCIESILWLIYAYICIPVLTLNEHIAYAFLLGITLHNVWFAFHSILALHQKKKYEVSVGLTFKEVIVELRKVLAYDSTVPPAEWNAFKIGRIPYTDAYRLLWFSLITVMILYR